MSRLRSVPRRRRSQEGFSLLEMIAVLLVIATATALAAPMISDAIAERKTQQAALDIVRLGRLARLETTATGRAHVLRYLAVSGGGDRGRMAVYRGQSGSCRTNPWDTIIVPANDCNDLDHGRPANATCIDSVDLNRAEHKSTNNTVQLRSAAANEIAVCFQPDGRMFYQIGGVLLGAGAPWLQLNNPGLGGGIVFTVQRFNNATATGVPRRVVFPLAGAPRILR